MSSASRDALVAMLSRLRDDLSRANLARPDDVRRALNGKYPPSGDYVVEVRRLCDRGIADGWLCPEGPEELRRSRVANVSASFPFSIHATLLTGQLAGSGSVPGEVGLCWPVDGSPKLSGRAPGWVVFPPGSKRAPEVTGGTMFLLSFASAAAAARKRKAVRPDRATAARASAGGRATARS